MITIGSFVLDRNFINVPGIGEFFVEYPSICTSAPKRFIHEPNEHRDEGRILIGRLEIVYTLRAAQRRIAQAWQARREASNTV